MSLVYFYSFYMFTININPNVENNYYIFYLAVMFIVVSPIILFFINPLLSSFSRKNEYEADNYAKMHSDSRALETSLLKLYKDNYSLVKSSPLYTFFYHTHPTVYERIIKLRKSETNE